MLPEVLRPAGFNIPVAALTIDGLGVTRFNSVNKEWQVAFIRTGHRFTIGIRKLDMQGRIVQAFSTVVVGETEPLKSLRFEFDNGSIDHFTTFPDGFFMATPTFPPGARRMRDNSYDYRWVIDFLSEVPHGQFVRLLRRDVPGRLPVTLITIPNALFYTKRVGEDLTILTPEGQPPQAGQVFGRTNEQIGAGIYATSTATPGKIYLRDAAGNNVDNFPINYEAGHIYEIFLLNMDVTTPGKLPSQPRDLNSNYVRGDLHVLYNLVEVAGTKHELFAAPRDSPRAIDGDCHIGGAGHNGGVSPDLSELLLP